MSTEKLPQWLTLTAEGAVIKLAGPETLNGMQCDTITLRTPRITDVRAAEVVFPDNVRGLDLMLYSSLAGVGQKDMEGLTVKNYNRVNHAYFRLVEDDEL